MNKLTPQDRLHLAKVGALAFGYIVAIIGIVAMILGAYYIGIKIERRKTLPKIESLTRHVKTLQADSTHKDSLIFR